MNNRNKILLRFNVIIYVFKVIIIIIYLAKDYLRFTGIPFSFLVAEMICFFCLGVKQSYDLIQTHTQPHRQDEKM